MSNCKLVKDLIPLYVEGLTSEESTQLIEQHIAECSDCQSYYELIKRDYEHQQKRAPAKRQIDEMIQKLGKYQRRLKLISVLIALFLTYIITGAEVPLLATIPFLILTPFVCRLFYSSSLPILLASIPFGLIGGYLSEHNATYIPFFAFIALITSVVGVGGATLIIQSQKQHKLWLKVLLIIPALAMILSGSLAYFSFYGNPIGYVQTMIKTQQYVAETYERGTLTFKGVGYNFKNNRHYGRYEYVINGVRQEASIGFYRNGEVDDYYQYMLEMHFAEERGAELKTYIAAAVDYAHLSIMGKPAKALQINQDVLNQRFNHLSYDLPRRHKAAELRESEGAKVSFEVGLGAFMYEYDRLSRAEFLERSINIFNAVQAHHFPFYEITVVASDTKGNTQRVTFKPNTTVEEIRASYRIEYRSDRSKSSY